MLPEISVVILSHNKLEYTRRCLTSLLQTDYSDWELVVIDNGSTDGSPEWLEEFRLEAGEVGVEVKLIFNDGNIGCSTSRNQGIDAAAGEFIVFNDNDVALRSRNWLKKMGERLTDNPSLAMIGPKLVYPFSPHNIQ